MAPPPNVPRPMKTVLPLADADWQLCLERVHDRSRGAPHDHSDVPDGLQGRPVPAAVPGCVHTDLLAAGLIPDPYVGDNELKLLWIGRCDWTYRGTFDLGPVEADHVELCFDGLDTVARVTLNGTELGRTRNMHRRYRFDVRPLLRAGGNELEVAFAAPLPAAFDEQDRLGELPHGGGGSNPSLPHNVLRKMACNFGWDWGPVLPTAGIWRDVRLEAWDRARLGDVRPVIHEATADRAVVHVHADVEGTGRLDAELHAELDAPDGRRTYAADARGVIAVPDPQLWWPVGHGGQPLYTLRVELRDSAGDVLDRRQHRIGLRTVEIDDGPDGPDGQHDEDQGRPAEGLGRGSRMRLLVNGRPVYCKGANWIPDDCFPHRVGHDRYRRRVEQAVGANMNMLRVWGGGVYEDDALYDLCDEAGVLVWQDFLMACSAYHEDERTHAEIDAEARDNVARLARHPCVALFNGCNENLWAYHDWKWKGVPWPEFIAGRPWGLRYYFETFPAVVAELAPATPYWPGSPSNGGGRDDFSEADADGPAHPNSNVRGNRHVWNVWHGPGHYANYFGHFPRFCSEFGFHGPPTHAALEAALPSDQRAWDAPVMRLHNKNGLSDLGDGQDKATARMADDFRVPEDFDRWLYLAQVMQARALQVGVGWFRSLAPWNHGALIWQLNDCWPCASWSMIDSDGTRGRAKPLLHAARRFFAPRVINLGPRRPTPLGGWNDDPGPLRAYLHNDHAEPWDVVLRLRRVGYDGVTADRHEARLRLPPRGAAHVDVPDAWTHDPARFLVAEADGGERAFWWHAADRDAPRPPAAYTAEVGDAAVTVHAQTLLRDVCLFVDRLHPLAEADDACVTLLPGESHTFRLTGPIDPGDPALTRTPVLCHA